MEESKESKFTAFVKKLPYELNIILIILFCCIVHIVYCFLYYFYLLNIKPKDNNIIKIFWNIILYYCILFCLFICLLLFFCFKKRFEVKISKASKIAKFSESLKLQA